MTHLRRRSAWPTTIIILVGLAGCSGQGGADQSTTTVETSTTEAPAVTTSIAPTTSTTGLPTTPTTGMPETTTTAPPEVSEWVIEPALATMPDDWNLEFVIPYGEADELLGSAPGGENLMLGPDYGAQAPDGSWWFMDAAKQRLAHYDGSGAYIDSVVLGPKFLAQDIYFQYQLPHILADGTLVASRFGGETTDLLVVRNGLPSLLNLAAVMFLKADDGELIYAFNPEGGSWAIEPHTGSTEPVDHFRSQSEDRYRISLANGAVQISLPDAGVKLEIPITASIGDGEVHASIEVATTVDGVIHLFVLGLSESDETVQLAGYTSVAPDGTVRPMSPIMNPFTPADPGSPGHIGAAHRAASPWFMVIGEDGVEVYTR